MLERERERIGNKRPMGHIAHLRNQFKFKKNHIAQNYDNIITLIRRAKTSLSLFWRNECSLLQDHSQELEMVGAKLLVKWILGISPVVQATSHVAKFHRVLGRGFMIQRVILIFIKCLSANQNQLFNMKV